MVSIIVDCQCFNKHLLMFFLEKRMLEFCSIVSYVVLMFILIISLVLNFRFNDLKYILVGSGMYRRTHECIVDYFINGRNL